MNVANYLARDIVERIKEIIKQDINYIDTKGVIIASTNEERIGTYHGGAKRVLSRKSEVIIHHEGEYPGAKQGINLPVYFQNKIIGIIGITGSEEEVVRYGKIIQSMTEILIKEAYIVEQEKSIKESIRQFVEELLFRNQKSDIKTLTMRSELLNIKTDILRVVITARIHKDHEKIILNTPTINEKLFNFIERYVAFNKQNLIIESGMNYIIILDINGINDIYGIIENINLNIEKTYNIKVCFGIGGVSNNTNEIRRSYTEAKKALDSVWTSREKCIKMFSELDIEILFDTIPQISQKRFVQRVFKNINSNAYEGIIEFLQKYIQNNGSITKTAEELYIHKNTVQYKLNKIKTLTGYDPRNIEDMTILNLASKLYLIE